MFLEVKEGRDLLLGGIDTELLYEYREEDLEYAICSMLKGRFRKSQTPKIPNESTQFKH